MTVIFFPLPKCFCCIIVYRYLIYLVLSSIYLFYHQFNDNQANQCVTLDLCIRSVSIHLFP